MRMTQAGVCGGLSVLLRANPLGSDCRGQVKGEMDGCTRCIQNAIPAYIGSHQRCGWGGVIACCLDATLVRWRSHRHTACLAAEATFCSLVSMAAVACNGGHDMALQV